MKGKTSQARKQRKRLFNLSLHQRRDQLSSSLSGELRKRFNRRSLPVRKGDKARVTTGSFKGVEGEVMGIDLKSMKVRVDKVVSKKRDGTEVLKPLDPSNITIIDVDLRDKRRQRVLERKVSRKVVESEAQKKAEERKKAEEERKRKEAEKKAAEKAKKEEKEKKAEEKGAKKAAKSGGGKKKEKEEKKKKTPVSEKGIDKKTKKDWIAEK